MVDSSEGMLAGQLRDLPSTDRYRTEAEQAEGLSLNYDFDFETLAGLGPIEDLRRFRK